MDIPSYLKSRAGELCFFAMSTKDVDKSLMITNLATSYDNGIRQNLDKGFFVESSKNFYGTLRFIEDQLLFNGTLDKDAENEHLENRLALFDKLPGNENKLKSGIMTYLEVCSGRHKEKNPDEYCLMNNLEKYVVYTELEKVRENKD